MQARIAARYLAEKIGFNAVDAVMIATAVSEVARNIVKYAKTGEVDLAVVELSGKRGLEVTARDQGPGISDLESAMEDGYSTAGGLGVGLPGSRRLMDEFHIASTAGKGTTV